MEGILLTILGCFAIGVILSAPMGPIGILCIQRTLNKGRESGLMTGVGAAASDLFYCLLTGLGFSIVTDWIEGNQNMLQIVGSVILLVYAIYLIKRNPATRRRTPDPEDDDSDSSKRETHYQDMVTGFFLTLSNPMIVFLIIPLFARFNFPTGGLPWGAVMAGYLFIVIGALAWWWLITKLVDVVRTRFNDRTMWVINIVIGVVILLLSLFGLFTGLRDYLTF